MSATGPPQGAKHAPWGAAQRVSPTGRPEGEQLSTKDEATLTGLKREGIMSGERGFTLIEVLVALAIVAVALAAGMRALAQSADGATALKARTLALWVAQNRLARAQLADPWPASGTRYGDETQAGTQLAWREMVTDTPNPAFRKIEIVVADPGVPDYALARLVGYLGNAPR